MSALNETLSRSIVFLFSENGTDPIGTGFVIRIPLPSDSNKFVPFIVTAKHVIGDNKKICGRFNTRDGTTAQITYDIESLKQSGDYCEHDDEGVDIVIFRTLHYENTDYFSFPIGNIASKQYFLDEDITPPDEIVYPCLLTNFMGSNKNYPFLRSGNIALIPDEPVPMKYYVGSREIITRQELILIDAISIPGASGCPIFLWPGFRLKGSAFVQGGEVILLGVMHGFYKGPFNTGHLIQTTEIKPIFSENTGIALIFPSWKLLEILSNEQISGMISLFDREEQEQRLMKSETLETPK